jgi:hypothetical protein
MPFREYQLRTFPAEIISQYIVVRHTAGDVSFSAISPRLRFSEAALVYQIKPASKNGRNFF